MFDGLVGETEAKVASLIDWLVEKTQRQSHAIVRQLQQEVDFRNDILDPRSGLGMGQCFPYFLEGIFLFCNCFQTQWFRTQAREPISTLTA